MQNISWESLKGFNIFEGLSEEELKLIFSKLDLTITEPNELITSDKTHADHSIYLLYSGKVELKSRGHTIELISKGECLRTTIEPVAMNRDIEFYSQGRVVLFELPFNIVENLLFKSNKFLRNFLSMASKRLSRRTSLLINSVFLIRNLKEENRSLKKSNKPSSQHKDRLEKMINSLKDPIMIINGNAALVEKLADRKNEKYLEMMNATEKIKLSSNKIFNQLKNYSKINMFSLEDMILKLKNYFTLKNNSEKFYAHNIANIYIIGDMENLLMIVIKLINIFFQSDFSNINIKAQSNNQRVILNLSTGETKHSFDEKINWFKGSQHGQDFYQEYKEKLREFQLEVYKYRGNSFSVEFSSN